MDLFGYVDGSVGNPAEDASEQVKQAFRSASKYICLKVKPEQQIHVRDTNTAKEAWGMP